MCVCVCVCVCTSLGTNLASVTDFKIIQTPHSLFCDLGGYKTFATRWSGGTVHVAISPKAVPEGSRRFRGQNQRPSSWGSSPALLARVGQASTKTGCFRVGSSSCGQRQARLRKTCNHSCNTDSVQESTRFNAL